MKKTEKTERKFVDNMSYVPKPENRLDTGTESQTVPGESYTIRELLLKHSQGLLPQIQTEGHYDDEEDFSDIDPMRKPDFDMVDITEKKAELYRQLDEEEEKEKEKGKKPVKKVEKQPEEKTETVEEDKKEKNEE